MNEQSQFKPYIPASSVTKEFTVTSIISGIILAVVFGAANAYLGLRVGMTISASIPAAVISMGIIRVLLKRNSILENNMVQTIGSAGESVAGGAIFTLPALYLWAKEGITGAPNIIMITLICLFGGLLGVLFMIPLRDALIVKEHDSLPYPEGTACAEVLLAGERGGASAKKVFAGMGIAALAKFIVDGIKVIPSYFAFPIKKLKTELSFEPYPALIGVGYICGIKTSGNILAGSILAWFVIIPAIILFGGNNIIAPGAASIAELYAEEGAGGIWDQYIRYVGAGAVAAAGIISLIRTLPTIVSAFTSTMKGLSKKDNGSKDRTQINMNPKVIALMIVIIIIALAAIPMFNMGIIGALLVVVFGFFFSTVSARITGVVGSSNSPVSGMTIATLLFVTIIFKLTGKVGPEGMVAALSVGAIICSITSISGDTAQDLQSGYILGATPKKQQIGEIIGVTVSALAIGGILILLDSAWGFGSKELPAPQATLMKMIVEGVMTGSLPWDLIFIGAAISVVVELMGINSLAVAIGVYLPLELSTTMMFGGILRKIIDKRNAKKTSENNESETDEALLYCSGLIAGEGLVGILLAIFAVTGLDSVIDLSAKFNLGSWGGIALIVAMTYSIWVIHSSKKNNKN